MAEEKKEDYEFIRQIIGADGKLSSEPNPEFLAKIKSVLFPAMESIDPNISVIFLAKNDAFVVLPFASEERMPVALVLSGMITRVIADFIKGVNDAKEDIDNEA